MDYSWFEGDESCSIVMYLICFIGEVGMRVIILDWLCDFNVGCVVFEDRELLFDIFMEVVNGINEIGEVSYDDDLKRCKE